MSKAELVRSLFEYNQWADERLLDAAARVSEALCPKSATRSIRRCHAS